jgi:hypothetical protein
MKAGVPRPDGLLITTPDDGSPEQQLDTVQCVHCGRHWVYTRAVLEAIRGGLGFCQRCNGITCGQACQACVPQEQQLDNIEAGRLDWREYRPIVAGWLPTKK